MKNDERKYVTMPLPLPIIVFAVILSPYPNMAGPEPHAVSSKLDPVHAIGSSDGAVALSQYFHTAFLVMSGMVTACARGSATAITASNAER